VPGSTKETRTDENVVVTWRHGWWFILNVHGDHDESRTITVFDKVYENPRGGNPCHLKIPQLDSILFVTEDTARQATVHIVNMKTRAEITIRAHDSSIGNALGQTDPAYSETVESITATKLVVVDKLAQYGKRRHFIDFATRVYEREEIDEREPDGTVTHRVLVGGKSPAR
jgi:hypothetical protein